MDSSISHLFARWRHFQVLNARVYDVAIDTPLQKAVNMSNDLGNDVFLKVRMGKKS